MAQTSHIRIDDDLKAKAADAFAGSGLTVSDAVRILPTRVAKEGGLPAGLLADTDVYDAWFRAKVHEALADPRAAIPHQQVMAQTKALIASKRSARA
ncbi:type II toxin-antitoxin system RelB/DinJ family antitoxin [Variovorax sp. DT-64]|uniref:type II toxin-antitoxin system RelB/DinJ family antitoxin n=1 Tax=Variovorax sp. DT-64 TaxID=3396160 RepID=UPI003F19F2D9